MAPLKMNAKEKNILNLRPMLEKVLKNFSARERIPTDPIQFPRSFYEQKKPQAEIEAIAFFTAMLSYGSAKQFTAKVAEILKKCDNNFFGLITSANKAEKFDWPNYRFSTSNDLKFFAIALGNIFKKNGTLENLFLKGFEDNKELLDGISSVYAALISELLKLHDKESLTLGLKHLLSDPAKKSCLKRWMMFLRWMCRPDDGVDMGLWKKVSPSKLIIPLDVHISRISRNIGLTNRTANDLATAQEITANLALLSPEDPVKYDFALCHLGISGKCTDGKNEALCRQCYLVEVCSKTLSFR